MTSLPEHKLPRDLFDALAAGGGGQEAVRALAAARYSKHLLLLRGVLAAAPDAGAEQARLARDGYELLMAVQQHDPAVARQALMHPAIGAWAIRVMRRPDSALRGADPGRLSAMAAAAAIQARLPAKIEVPASGAGVLLPALGQAQLSAGTAVVRTADSHAEVSAGHYRVEVPSDPYHDAPGWLGLRRLRAGPLSVLLDDLDPFRMPSSTSLAPRLGPAEIRKLSTMLRQASLLLEAEHPAIAAELAETVKVVVPLSEERGGQASSSSSATFGAVALSQPPDRYVCAATLAHEIQHLKLSVLLDIVDLTLPDDGRGYYAPWRDDPRPIAGLLQGAYAFLGVTGFWQRQRANGAAGLTAHTEFARWREATARTIDTLLASGRLTPAGTDFAAGMLRTSDSWRKDPVPAEAGAQARREAEHHLARWEADYGPIRP